MWCNLSANVFILLLCFMFTVLVALFCFMFPWPVPAHELFLGMITDDDDDVSKSPSQPLQTYAYVCSSSIVIIKLSMRSASCSQRLLYSIFTKINVTPERTDDGWCYWKVGPRCLWSVSTHARRTCSVDWFAQRMIFASWNTQHSAAMSWIHALALLCNKTSVNIQL